MLSSSIPAEQAELAHDIHSMPAIDIDQRVEELVNELTAPGYGTKTNDLLHAFILDLAADDMHTEGDLPAILMYSLIDPAEAGERLNKYVTALIKKYAEQEL